MMTTDEMLDKLCNVTPIIADLGEELSGDSEFKQFILTYKSSKNNAIFLLRILPFLLKKYRDKMYELLATWNEEEVDTIKAQPFSKTVTELKEIFESEDLRGFFSQSYSPKDTAAE